MLVTDDGLYDRKTFYKVKLIFINPQLVKIDFIKVPIEVVFQNFHLSVNHLYNTSLVLLLLLLLLLLLILTLYSNKLNLLFLRESEINGLFTPFKNN